MLSEGVIVDTWGITIHTAWLDVLVSKHTGDGAMDSMDSVHQKSLAVGQLEWTLESNCPHTDLSHASWSPTCSAETMDSMDSMDTCIQPGSIYVLQIYKMRM